MKLKPLSDFVYYLHYLNYIQRWQKADYKKKVKETHPPRLTQEQKDQIKAYWGDLYDSEAAYESFYNLFTESFDPRYLPENLYYLFIDPYLNKGQAAKILDDKNLYDYILHDIRRPRTVARIVEGELYDASFQPISPKTFFFLCNGYDKIIVKPSILTSSSSGIIILDKEEYGKLISFISNLRKEDNYIFQEYIEQHEELSALHASSINTIRLLSLNWKGRTIVLSGIVRMGVNGSTVDNFTVGGIAVGIQDSGRLKKYAYNLSGRKFDRHPQGEYFDNHYVPNYQDLVKLCKSLAPRFTSVSRLISWDFAIGKDGLPILIEVNLKCGGFDFHQLTNGPVFGDIAKEILAEIFSNRRNKLLRWWYNKII